MEYTIDFNCRGVLKHIAAYPIETDGPGLPNHISQDMIDDVNSLLEKTGEEFRSGLIVISFKAALDVKYCSDVGCFLLKEALLFYETGDEG